MESSETTLKTRMRYCCVKSCPNFRGTTDQHIYFFNLPIRNSPEVRAQWELAVTGKQTGNFYCGRICERHFRPEDIHSYGPRKNYLKDGAIPVYHISNDTPAAQLKLVNIETIKNKTNDTESVDGIVQNPPKDKLNIVDINATTNQTNGPNLASNKVSKQSSFCVNCAQKNVQLQAAKIKIESLKAKIHDLETKNQQLRNQTKRLEPGPANNSIREDNPMEPESIATKKCSLCKVVLTPSEFYKHLCLDQDTIQCTFCVPRKSFKITANFLKHIACYHPEILKNVDTRTLYKCNYCAVIFPMEVMMKCHQKSHETITQYHQQVEQVTFKDESVETMSIDESTSESVFDLPESSYVPEKIYAKEEADDELGTYFVSVKEEVDDEIIEPIEPSTSNEMTILKNDEVKSSKVVQHINKYFKCGICDMAFEEPVQLKTHIRDEHSIRKQFKCEKCNMTFGMVELIGSHVCDADSKIEEASKCNESGMELEKPRQKRRIARMKYFQCYLCKIDMDSKEALRMHMKLHSRDHLCDVCKVAFTLKELNYHLCDNEGSICCEYCQQTFTTTIKLLEHLKSHQKKKLYRCDECFKLLPMIKLKQYHMRLSHTQPKLFTCTICSKAFTTKSLRNIHEKSHNAVRSHLCDECGRGFRSARNLKLHKESSMHVAEALFQCPDCPHKCYRKDQLKRHRKVHIQDSFVCEICSAQLPSMKSLLGHMTRHTRTEANRKYACSLCPKKFFSSEVLKSHQAVHGTAKLHACQYCEQSFKYGGDLHKHLKIHLGELRYQCEKCDKRFKYKVEAVKHEFEHYKQEKSERNEIE
ncbi:zinc finger protein 845-like isoform X2 [Contarinia nasturtii]|uniref:zinc finger protein 845-like isoform X2 n=1 Tax=Contarinia nasturtii TaxID=265458 RepID=UPI0012D4AC97|nr:zinc finger protein 845-like isoform X2 [Contarinia nasturtii]